MSDLDGTLLNEKHVLSKENKDAILKMREHGISFMPASGRDYPAVLDAIQDLGIHPKCICLNGAEFYDNDGNLLADYPIDKVIAKQVIDLVNEYDQELIYFCNDGRYTKRSAHDMFELFVKAAEVYGEGRKMNFEDHELFHGMNTEKDISKILERDIMKIEILVPDQEIKTKIFKALKSIDQIETTSSHEFNLEVNSDKATKGTMISKVCEVYGYKHDEIVVIGDGVNDVSMLKKFDNSFAMGQASEDVKKYATYIAKPNHEDGVAQVIHELLANNNEIK